MRSALHLCAARNERSIRRFLYIALCIVPSSNNRFDTLRWSEKYSVRASSTFLIQLWDSIHKISHKLTIVGGFFIFFVVIWSMATHTQEDEKNRVECLMTRYRRTGSLFKGPHATSKHHSKYAITEFDNTQ